MKELPVLTENDILDLKIKPPEPPDEELPTSLLLEKEKRSCLASAELMQRPTATNDTLLKRACKSLPSNVKKKIGSRTIAKKIIWRSC